MKFKMIKPEDVKTLREARKVLKRLKKREERLEALERKTPDYPDYYSWKAVELEHRRMLGELIALHIDVYEDSFELTAD